MVLCGGSVTTEDHYLGVTLSIYDVSSGCGGSREDVLQSQ